MRVDSSLDLTQLYKRCVFRSDAAVESHDLVARELSDHKLRWERGAINTSLFKTKVRRMHVLALHYGPEVEVTPKPFEDFVLVHTSLRGGAEIISDGERISIPEGRSAVVSARKSLRLGWQRGSRQLIVKVPHALLGTPEQPGGPARDIPLSYVLPVSVDNHWRLMMQSLLNASSLPSDTPAHDQWLDHFETNIAMFLATHDMGQGRPSRVQDGSFGGDHGSGVDDFDADEHHDKGLLGSTDRQRIEALEEHMRRVMHAPVTLSDLASATGISSRALNTLCQRLRGTSPMELLRSMRLDAVRRKLLVDAHANVTDAAMDMGFMHLGRFSAFYKERFSELPSETLSRRASR